MFNKNNLTYKNHDLFQCKLINNNDYECLICKIRLYLNNDKFFLIESFIDKERPGFINDKKDNILTCEEQQIKNLLE